MGLLRDVAETYVAPARVARRMHARDIPERILLVYLMAADSDAECNVSYYGVGIDEQLDKAPAITTPTILHIAEEDGFVSKEAQAKINDGLKGHAHVAVHNYPGVDHAFARNNGVNYDAAAATLADERTLACFKENLS